MGGDDMVRQRVEWALDGPPGLTRRRLVEMVPGGQRWLVVDLRRETRWRSFTDRVPGGGRVRVVTEAWGLWAADPDRLIVLGEEATASREMRGELALIRLRIAERQPAPPLQGEAHLVVVDRELEMDEPPCRAVDVRRRSLRSTCLNLVMRRDGLHAMLHAMGAAEVHAMASVLRRHHGAGRQLLGYTEPPWER